MELYYKMTVQEYDDLCANLSTPNTLLTETIDNLTNKLSVAKERIEMLEKENSMYAIGGAKKRLEPKVVSATSWKGNDEQRLKTYFQEHNRLSKKGEDFSDWNVHNLAEELGRTLSAVKSKARSMGYRVFNGYIIRAAV